MNFFVESAIIITINIYMTHRIIKKNKIQEKKENYHNVEKINNMEEIFSKGQKMLEIGNYSDAINCFHFLIENQNIVGYPYLAFIAYTGYGSEKDYSKSIYYIKELFNKYDKQPHNIQLHTMNIINDLWNSNYKQHTEEDYIFYLIIQNIQNTEKRNLVFFKYLELIQKEKKEYQQLINFIENNIIIGRNNAYMYVPFTEYYNKEIMKQNKIENYIIKAEWQAIEKIKENYQKYINTNYQHEYMAACLFSKKILTPTMSRYDKKQYTYLNKMEKIIEPEKAIEILQKQYKNTISSDRLYEIQEHTYLLIYCYIIGISTEQNLQKAYDLAEESFNKIKENHISWGIENNIEYTITLKKIIEKTHQIILLINNICIYAKNKNIHIEENITLSYHDIIKQLKDKEIKIPEYQEFFEIDNSFESKLKNTKQIINIAKIYEKKDKIDYYNQIIELYEKNFHHKDEEYNPFYVNINNDISILFYITEYLSNSMIFYHIFIYLLNKNNESILYEIQDIAKNILKFDVYIKDSYAYNKFKTNVTDIFNISQGMHTENNILYYLNQSYEYRRDNYAPISTKAYFLEQGHFYPKDIFEAIKLYKEASEMGCKFAKNKIQEYAKMLEIG